MAIIVNIESRVATVTLNRPEALNALNQETFGELIRLWPELDNNDDVRVVVLTGMGRAFCAGADIKEMAERMKSGVGMEDTLGRDVGSDFLPLHLKKPLIAAVNGSAAGGGVGMVLCSDIAICAEEAFFTTPYAARGVMDAEVVALLVRKVSPGWAMWMGLTGQRLDAQTAWRIGLVNEVLPKDQLMDRARDLAEQIQYNAPLSTMAIKEKMKRALETSFQEAMAQKGHYEKLLMESSMAREGFIAAAEKRKPEFES